MKRSIERLRAWCVGAGCVLLCQAAVGAETTTFAVTAQFAPSCTVAAGSLNFGSSIPTPVTAPVYSTSAITAVCSASLSYTVQLGAGTGPSATPALRQLTTGTSFLSYTIFEDAARTRVWGDGTAGTVVSEMTGTGTAQTLTAFGSIPAGQAPGIGTYTDTVTVTIVF
jgi:spore coat protein U-like protein